MNTSFFGILIASFIAFIFPKRDHTFDHMQQIFLHKKTNPNPRSIELKSETIVKGIPLEHNDLLYLQTILSKCKCKKYLLYKIGSQSKQYFMLINDQNQNEDYLWMISELFYYPKINRYFIIRDKKDKEWMKNFFEKYDKIIENRESHSF